MPETTIHTSAQAHVCARHAMTQAHHLSTEALLLEEQQAPMAGATRRAAMLAEKDAIHWLGVAANYRGMGR